MYKKAYLIVCFLAMILLSSCNLVESSSEINTSTIVTAENKIETSEIAQFKISPDSVNLKCNQTLALRTNESIKGVKWSSDNPFAVSVNQEGILKGGHKSGSAIITAEYQGMTESVFVNNQIDIRDITATDLVSDMKIGVNFASAFDRIADNLGYDSYSNPVAGKDKITYYQQDMSDTTPPTLDMISELKKAGYNAVRLTVSWSVYTDDKTYQIDEKWLDTIETYVNAILENDMYCIINSHYDYLGKSWVGDMWTPAWMFDEYKPYVDGRFGAIWKQVAERFKDYDDYLLFEAMNEPSMTWEAYNDYMGFSTWEEYANSVGESGYDDLLNKRVNEMNKIFVDAIRGTGGNNLNRFLLIGPAMEQSFYLSYLQVPDDRKIIGTVHYYYSSEDEGGAYTTWSSQQVKNTDPIDEAFENIKTFMDKTQVPIILGEWGNTSTLSIEDRVDQATYIVSKAAAMNIPCYRWESGWYDWEPSNESFGIFDRENMKWVWPEILEAEMNAIK